MDVPNDLTVPAPGSTTARRIVGAYLRRTATDLLRLPIARFQSRVADDFAKVRRVLETEFRGGNRGALFSIVRRPTHSTLVRCIDAELWGGGDVSKLDAWLTELTGLLAFELAAAGLLPEHGISLRRCPRRLLSIGSGVEVTLAADLGVGFRPGFLVLERDGVERRIPLDDLGALTGEVPPGMDLRRAYEPLGGGVAFALADNNPLSELEAHPDKQGNALDLGGHTEKDWTNALSDALALIEAHLPELAEEMRLLMQLLLPVGFDRERHLSASYAEAIGSAYLSLHPDGMTMAEALIHEFSHNKINALARLEPLLENGDGARFGSPLRPDPRPLHGVLLAVHAFVPVARLYERMIEARDPLASSPDFRRRLSRILAQNHDGTETLRAHAQATEVGRGVLDELVRWDTYYRSLRDAEPSSA